MVLRFVLLQSIFAVGSAVAQFVSDCMVGRLFTCAILNNNSMKCFGDGTSGQLGLEIATNMGQGPHEMGDNLPTVDVGAGKTVKQVAGGEDHTCAILDDDSLKCFGGGYDGQLGLESATYVGKVANEMGENLPTVDVGTGRTVTQVVAGRFHTCIILDDSSMKCFGQGFKGQLGLGSTAKVGRAGNEMGDYLPIVDMGVGRTVKQVTAGREHTCAILDDDSLKCFGNGDNARLGGLHLTNKGDEPLEMGDYLPALDLGVGRTAKLVSSGKWHNCVILDDDSLKCFGKNERGQSGFEADLDLGDDANEMGDYLPVVDLGNGRMVKHLVAGNFHTCVVLDDDSLKCFGDATYGQTGHESKAGTGNAAGQMGDYLPAVDLGFGRTVKKVCRPGTRNLHVCVILDDDSLRCWGRNNYGQLGRGSTDGIIGGGPDEMGDNLKFVRLFDIPTTTPIAVSSTNPTTTPAATTPAAISTIDTSERELELSVMLNVTYPEEFMQEEGIEAILQQAMAELVSVDLAWIKNLNVFKVRRLTPSSAFIGAPLDIWKERELSSTFALATKSGNIRVEFDVVIPPDGGPGKVTATLLLEEFNAKSMEEASEIVDTVIKSGALGSKDYDVAVVMKEGSIKRESSTTVASSEDGSAISTITIIVSGSAAFAMLALSLTVWRCRRVRKLNSEERNLNQICSDPCPRDKSNTPSYFSEAGLLFPRKPISLDCRRQLSDFIAGMLDYSKPVVFVCFAIGHKWEDEEESGLGLFYAGAVVQALQKQGIGCYASLSPMETNTNVDFVSGKSSSYKLFLLIDTRPVYECRKCLEQIHSAQANETEIIRLQFEGDLPQQDSQWQNLRYDDFKALQMREMVRKSLLSQRVLPEAPELVQSVLGFLETFSLDLGRRFKTLESLAAVARDVQSNADHYSSVAIVASTSTLVVSKGASSHSCDGTVSIPGISSETCSKQLAKKFRVAKTASEGAARRREKEHKKRMDSIDSSRGVGRSSSGGGGGKKKREKTKGGVGRTQSDESDFTGGQKKQKGTQSASLGAGADIVGGIKIETSRHRAY